MTEAEALTVQWGQALRVVDFVPIPYHLGIPDVEDEVRNILPGDIVMTSGKPGRNPKYPVPPPAARIDGKSYVIILGRSTWAPIPIECVEFEGKF